MTAYVLLEDGTRFDGEACGAPGAATGEVVFTTGMAGYQESMTDPSFAGQLIAYTYPHIGNYGVSAAAMESGRAWGRAAIMREAGNRDDAPRAEQGWLDWLDEQGVPGITGVDTRGLVRHIREAGAMRGGLFPGTWPRTRPRADRRRAGHGRRRPGPSGLAGETRRHGEGSGPLVAAIDTGIKSSIVRELVARGARVDLHPCTTSAAELLATSPTRSSWPTGPGIPPRWATSWTPSASSSASSRRGASASGHQLLCQAVGLQTFKLRFGHRGRNHPVKDLTSGRIEITSQNHGFAVVGPDGRHEIASDAPARFTTDVGAAQLTHVNLYDRTVEGLQLLDVHGGTVQYHPEAGPGPNDAKHLFDRFLADVEAAR
jgi:carbamoyl-phosphate synthase small subunit